MKPKVIFLVGPTAIGKTKISLFLAEKINAEIICCDSMQVYKELNILTCKPSKEEQKVVPHHLIDQIGVDKEYNVSKYRTQAVKKIKEIVARGHVPLFVGGSGLYMSVVVDGIFKKTTEDLKYRAELEKEAQEKGSLFLHEKLQKVDAKAAERIHTNDLKRIVRALEVYKVTGKPISQLQQTRKGLTEKYDVHMFCLDMPRDILYKRIDERVEQMFEEGLIEEVKNVLRKKLSKTSQFAIGINEVKGYLEGKYDLETAKSMMKRNTQLYSKRQQTWFRKDKRIVWVDVSKDKIETVVEKIIKGMS